MFYWILEYGKVLAAYLIVMYLWPSVVLRKYLSNKGLAYRFSFCATFMILLLNTTVLMLGIVKLLNQWVIRILFYGPLVYVIGVWLYRHRDKAIHIKYLLTDICSPKRFVAGILNQIGSSIRNIWKRLLNKLRPQLPLYIMLLVAVIYGMIYFSYGAFHERYYGTSDIYVHHSWIDMLQEGKIFGAGIYPEGMHCFVYAMSTLFGIEVYSCLLFLGGINISVFLLSVYLFFREIFPWKYSGVLVVVLYLILRLDSAAHIGGMARLQNALPQEFALFTVFLCGAYLLRFLRNASAGTYRWKRWVFLRDENLLIFMMALAVSIAVHFYITMMAFFLCLAIGVFFLAWVVKKKKLGPLLITIVCGVLIAVIPMATALACGMKFQGSINWAMSVITDSQQAIQDKENNSTKPTNSHWDIIDSDIHGSGEENPDKAPTMEETPEEEPPEPTWLEKLYQGSFIVLYRDDRAAVLASCVVLGALIGLICHIVAMIKRKAAVGEDPFCGYLFLAAADLIFMIMFAAPVLDLLEIIQIDRLCAMTHLLTIATVMIPVDLIMTLISRKGSRLMMDICAVVMCVAMCVSVIALGEYHSYLGYVVTRYTAAAEVTRRIVHDMKPESFTVVSSVDELYQVKGYGYHEEAVRFIHEMKEETYTLPTEYVFLYIEKQPLDYAHTCLLDGMPLLAKQEYLELYGATRCCQSPDVLHSEISEENANLDIYIPISHASYTNLVRRTVINSRLYQWAERFRELYPYHLTTVYEDDAFVCYMFRQNPARLLELAIMD